MNNKSNYVNKPLMVILYILAGLILFYGVYLANEAVVYTHSLEGAAALSGIETLNYVLADSGLYFGLGIIIYAAAAIIGTINKVQSNIHESMISMMYDGYYPEYDVEEITEITETKEIEEAEVPDEPAEELTSEVTEAVEEPIEETVEVPLTEPVEEAEIAEPEIESVEMLEFEAEIQPEAEVQLEPETVRPAQPGDLGILAEKFSSQFISEKTKEAPAPETPEASPLPEDILQTKRKRGLKYETISMEDNPYKEDLPHNLSDTIRFNKEDREAITKALHIKDIFEEFGNLE